MMNRKGFTLVEIIISLALLGIVLSLSANFLFSTIHVPDRAMNEYDVQFEMRMLSQRVTTVIRDASATFSLHRTNHNNLTDGWNYIIPSMDQTSIIEYKWNGTTHVPEVIAKPQDGVTYTLVFRKLNPSYADNLLEYDIVANVNGQSREIKSEVEALNSLQVIDRGSTSLPANALAYRTDPRPTEISDAKAAVAFVLDKSGSMDWRMDGNHDSNDSSSNSDRWSRMKKLRIEANRLIDGLSANPNIYASIVPFDSTSNGSFTMEPVRVNDTASSVMKDKINSLSAGGGTNTGDGIRRGYNVLADFNDAHDEYTVKNFMVILVDGVTTFYSAHRVNSPGTNLSNYTFVTGSSNIDNHEISSYNTTYPQGRYGGNGGSLDYWGTKYVDLMGEDYVQAYGSGSTADKETIKVYVIGFSADSDDYGSLNDIASATGSDGYYQAGDSETLNAIFAAIQKDINDSLWHIGGPN